MRKIPFFLVLMAFVFVLVASCAPGTGIQLNTPAPNTEAKTPAPDGGEINVPGVSIQVNAPGPNPLLNKPNAKDRVAGIWMGIWHGIISPVTLVVSFSNPNVQMYEVYNDGSQYNFGFLIGMAILFAILGLIVGSRRR